MSFPPFPHPMLGRRLGLVIPATAETAALIARMSVEPSQARVNAIDTLIVALKTAGIWAKLDCLYVMAAHDQQAAKLNWIANQDNLAEVNAPAWTVDRGFTGDTAGDKWLSSTFSPGNAGAKFVQNSCFLGAWMRTVAPTNFDLAIGGALTPFCDLATCYTDNAFYGYLNQAGSGGTAGASPQTAGLYATSRTAAAVLRMFKDTTRLLDTTTTTTGLNTGTLEVCHGFGGASNNQMAIAAVGAGLTDAEVSSLYSALNNYRAAVGA